MMINPRTHKRRRVTQEWGQLSLTHSLIITATMWSKFKVRGVFLKLQSKPTHDCRLGHHEQQHTTGSLLLSSPLLSKKKNCRLSWCGGD